jgi:hypothetical protein
MTVHDEAFYDNIAALALGILPASEAESMVVHVSMCADCRLLYSSLRATADLVGYQEEAVGDRFDEVSRFRLKSRILKSIRTTDVAPMIPPSTNGVPLPPRKNAKPERRVWLAWGIAAAALLIAAINTISDSTLGDYNNRLVAIANEQKMVANTSLAQARELDRRIAEIVSPGGKRYPIPGGVILARDGKLLIALHDLPPLPKGKVYQAWTRKRGATLMTPRDTFSPDPSGVAFVDVPASPSEIEAVAVSVEPAHGSSVPTTKPTFVRTLV